MELLWRERLRSLRRAPNLKWRRKLFQRHCRPMNPNCKPNPRGDLKLF